WWESFGTSGQLLTPVVSKDGRAVAVLPLILEARRLRYVGHSVSDYCLHITAPGHDVEALKLSLNALFERSKQWDEIHLQNVPDDSRFATAIRELPARWKRMIVEIPNGPCPTLLLGKD